MDTRLFAADLLDMLPELTLFIAIIIISLLDLFWPKNASKKGIGVLTLIALIVSAGFLIYQRIHLDGVISLLNDSYLVYHYGILFKLIVLLGVSLIVMMSFGAIRDKDIPHIGEYYVLLMPAALGAMIMASSADIITLFIGLELLSISSYILVALRKHHTKSNEAAFKYIVLGSIASAFILYGMSFLYGMGGSTNLFQIGATLQSLESSFHPMIYVSFFLLLVGFGFKLAAAPFHTWAPEVYSAAPTPVVSFLAVISKAAMLIFMFMFLPVYFVPLDPVQNLTIYSDVVLTLHVVAAISMIVGNIVALMQKNVKRLLAFSSIANAGYFLVVLSTDRPGELVYYLVAYLLMTIGIFAVVTALENSAEHQDISIFSGLYFTAPVTAVMTVILLLSLAGIPLTMGFLGKFFILLGVIQVKTYWLAAIMIVSSVISFYYYFRIIRLMFMRSHSEHTTIKVPVTTMIVIAICVVATIFFAFFPQYMLSFIEWT
ncbi:NADH-quinone oxidoreductase subunit N [Longirhabdus pacifica]|uniref:NADH-quinone oxidoreductase subunit N n=1 Tax=Longirhabdus pacifica TaxID=2305227 RepID=UPI001009331E|nr:NADH-quinone oxidoreductase subunit N [Longirhabdus pacifica]